jgi:SNF2 family DNA or RNA helicase
VISVDTMPAGVGSDVPQLTPAYLQLLARLAQAADVDPAASDLVDDAVAVWSRPGFDTFVSLPRLRFEPFEHQRQTAQTVLRRMRGRAILADEVGLGKTIEAGLVLSELRLRGLANRALIIVPAGLVEQWREELDRKFALPSVVARASDWSARDDGQIVIASIAAARRDPLRSAVVGDDWELVIIDEAHRVRNARSASGRLARDLRSRYLLLLTATPVENRLDDLFELVSLVSPGLLGTAAQFRRRHGGGGAATDAASVRDIAGLRARTREVMVRHRRSEVALMLPQRLAETIRVTPGDDERLLYAELSARVRQEGRGASPSRLLTLRSLARLAGSSPAALAPGLEKIGWTELAERAAAVQPEKQRVLLGRIRRHLDRGEKVIVFTAFRRTLDDMARALAGADLPAAVYHGSLARGEKERAIAEFRDERPVLLTTESAGEGRNLQFCHAMINVDLPWNPMQIEQRLGRLHRIGQRSDVVLTNLVGRGTIEERILHVLESKINLFELVVGELDMILGRVDDDFDLESSIFNAYVESADDAEFDSRLAALGDALAAARSEYLSSRTAVDALVHEDGR